MSLSIIRVRIINKGNHFGRVDLVSNHKRKIGTWYRKARVAKKYKKAFQQQGYYYECDISNRGKKKEKKIKPNE